jgi:hypothetical protein
MLGRDQLSPLARNSLFASSGCRWLVIGTSEPRLYRTRLYWRRAPVWVCQCDCGTVRSVLAANLLAEKSTSCGCWKREITGRKMKAFWSTPRDRYGEPK